MLRDSLFLILTYLLIAFLPTEKNTQVSGAEFDMVMSTKEQESFETALSARDGFESIKEGISQVDVRQVRTPPFVLPWL